MPLSKRKRRQAESTPAKSARKRAKKLDSYINKKLRNDRRAELLEQVAKTQSTDKSKLVSTAAIFSQKSEKIDSPDLSEESDNEKEDALGSGLAKDAQGNPRKPIIIQKPAKTSAKSKFAKVQTSSEPESDFDSSQSSGSSGDDSGDDSEDDTNPEGDSENSDQSANASSIGPPRRKKGAFASWATQQLNNTNQNSSETVINTEDTKTPTVSTSEYGSTVPHPHTNPTNTNTNTNTNTIKKKSNKPVGPLGENIVIPSDSLLTSEPAFVVNVERSTEAQEARMKLPILSQEDTIMDAIRQNAVVVICGETGSGKTTQVPQFLYEVGWGSKENPSNPGMICITQPRRLAAMSMASRVSSELNLPSSRVSYQIRYDTTISPDTSIKFATDGVLLRELAQDFLLQKYSAIIVDEAHERSVNTDVLIGVLSRVVKLRVSMWRKGEKNMKPLRLIIMSATLRVQDFTENKTLFDTPPPVINVEARQYPVTIHFSRRTQADYVTEAFRKVSRIHARLPPGAILVFLTGQNEIHDLCRKLRRRFGHKIENQANKPSSSNAKRKKVTTSSKKGFRNDAPSEDEDEGGGDVDVEGPSWEGAREDNRMSKEEEREREVSAANVGEGDEELDPLDTDSDENEYEEEGDDDDDFKETDPMYVLPLYAMLPSEKQSKVFEPPPEGCRLVVVATNVAETSLTIPGIRYVVDSGRAKERTYDVETGVESFNVSWTSKASAGQRAGRAGRTGPGHCYRLYSSAVYEDFFEQHSKPEILRMPIEGLVLQMKAMNLDSVVNFPFPTPPDRYSLQKAQSDLVHLGALTAVNNGAGNGGGGQITSMGRSMALFPIQPRLSKMLVNGQQQGCLPFVIVIVCALSVGNPFLREEDIGGEDAMMDAKMVLSSSALAELHMVKDPELKQKEERRLLRKAFFANQEQHAALGGGASDIFKILSVVGAYMYHNGTTLDFCRKHFVRAKVMEEIVKLRAQICKLIMSNFPDVDVGLGQKLQPPSDGQLKALRQLLTASYIDQVAVRKDIAEKTSREEAMLDGKMYAYRTLNVTEDVYIHQTSCLSDQNASPPPAFVIYKEAQQTSKRTYIREITKINPGWLADLGRTLCTFSRGQIGKEGLGDGRTEREVSVVPTYGGRGLAVELPAVRVVEQRRGGRWVRCVET